jgi:hypothetical protein
VGRIIVNFRATFEAEGRARGPVLHVSPERVLVELETDGEFVVVRCGADGLNAPLLPELTAKGWAEVANHAHRMLVLANEALRSCGAVK